MNAPDLFNGALEFVGGLFILNHCQILYRAKMSRGVSKLTVTFFTLWGFWNLFYYPHLDQWLSFLGGISIALANCVWIALLWHYRKN